MCLSRSASEQRELERKLAEQRAATQKPMVQRQPDTQQQGSQQQQNFSYEDISALKAKAKAQDLSELLAVEQVEVPRAGSAPAAAAVAARARSRQLALVSESARSLVRFLPMQPQEDSTTLQWREFGLIYIAYMGFLVSRKNYGFWLRPVISELGYAKGQAGLIGSTLEVAYGTCSFLNGVVVRADDRSHARHQLLQLRHRPRRRP
jgi:hypothetical protein